jgi:hypothetical protein
MRSAVRSALPAARGARLDHAHHDERRRQQQEDAEGEAAVQQHGSEPAEVCGLLLVLVAVLRDRRGRSAGCWAGGGGWSTCGFGLAFGLVDWSLGLLSSSGGIERNPAVALEGDLHPRVQLPPVAVSVGPSAGASRRRASPSRRAPACPAASP